MELRKRNTVTGVNNVPMVVKATMDSPAHLSRPSSASAALLQEKASPSKRPTMPPSLPRTPTHNASMSINRRKCPSIKIDQKCKFRPTYKIVPFQFLTTSRRGLAVLELGKNLLVIFRFFLEVQN